MAAVGAKQSSLIAVNDDRVGCGFRSFAGTPIKGKEAPETDLTPNAERPQLSTLSGPCEGRLLAYRQSDRSSKPILKRGASYAALFTLAASICGMTAG